MEEAANNQPPKPKSPAGRKPKLAADKAKNLVGTFALTDEQKRIYDQMFAASGLKNQSEFFRHILFQGYLKLYYIDENTNLIYKKLQNIHSELNQIGRLYNQAVKALNTVHKDNISPKAETAKLVELTERLKGERDKLLSHYERIKVVNAKGVVHKNIQIDDK